MKRKWDLKRFVVLCLAVCLILGGCSADKEAYVADYSNSAEAKYSSEAALDDYGSDVAMASDASEVGVTFATDKKIIYQSDVVMETMVYNDTYTRLLELIKKYKGYIEYESYNNQMRSYLKDNSGKGKLVISTNNLTIRIPSSDYSNFMQEGLTLGNVLSRNQTITDKTSEYNTNKSYVDILMDEADYLAKQLDVLEQELKEAQANDKHYDDIIRDMKDVASRKAQVEKELVPYRRVLDDIDEKVEYSTINMELREVNEYTVIEEEIEEESFGSQIKKSWKNAMSGLSNMFKSIFLFLIDVIPTLVGLVLFGIVFIFVWKLVRKIIVKRRKNRPVVKAEVQTTSADNNPVPSGTSGSSSSVPYQAPYQTAYVPGPDQQAPDNSQSKPFDLNDIPTQNVTGNKKNKKNK